MKKLIIILFAIFNTVILVGCAESEKNIEEITEDLLASDYIDASFTIDSIDIEKRQTDKKQKTDIVFVSAEATNEDGIKLEGEYKLFYTLYNDGWEIDNIEAISENTYPISGTEYDEDALKMILLQNGYTGVSDFLVDDHQMSKNYIGHGMYGEGYVRYEDIYTLEFVDEHKYMAEYVMAELVIPFVEPYGWFEAESYLNILESNKYWYLCGEYIRMGIGERSYENGDHIEILDVESNDDIMTISLSNGSTERTYILENVSNKSIEHHITNAEYSGTGKIREDGYSAKITNGNWNDIEYGGRSKDKYGAGLFVGKDCIYWRLREVTSDDYLRVQYLEFEYELIPIDD